MSYLPEKTSIEETITGLGEIRDEYEYPDIFRTDNIIDSAINYIKKLDQIKKIIEDTDNTDELYSDLYNKIYTIVEYIK